MRAQNLRLNDQFHEPPPISITSLRPRSGAACVLNAHKIRRASSFPDDLDRVGITFRALKPPRWSPAAYASRRWKGRSCRRRQPATGSSAHGNRASSPPSFHRGPSAVVVSRAVFRRPLSADRRRRAKFTAKTAIPRSTAATPAAEGKSFIGIG